MIAAVGGEKGNCTWLYQQTYVVRAAKVERLRFCLAGKVNFPNGFTVLFDYRNAGILP